MGSACLGPRLDFHRLWRVVCQGQFLLNGSAVGRKIRPLHLLDSCRDSLLPRAANTTWTTSPATLYRQALGARSYTLPTDM